MRFRLFKRLCGGLVVTLAFLPSALLLAQETPTEHQQAVAKYRIPPQSEPELTTAELIKQLRKNIKYVFVVYQENRSFDSYFGTFPSAEGLFTSPPAQTPGFYQQIINTDGSVSTIHPFRIGPNEFAADLDDLDNGHASILSKMDVQNGVPRMDQFAVREESDYYSTGNPPLMGKQAGELTMAYEDCDTIPLLWAYANRFVLFDHIFTLQLGPSTPGNLTILGAQTGVTQWALHPDQATSVPEAQAVPVVDGSDPFWGSLADPTPQAEKMPVEPGDMPEYGMLNLTFATLPLTLMGENLKNVVKSDRDPIGDLDDVQKDVDFISHLNQERVPFGWYQEGFDKEPTDPNPGPADGTHVSYIAHHNPAQYFGYISNNPKMSDQLHGLDDFFLAVKNKTLPTKGGVFFVKGGRQNIFNLKPVDPDPAVQANFMGDDEHPGYSDAQIGEAMVAEAVNKIAASPYWAHSAIIILFDDSLGHYDHVPPPLRVKGPDGTWISDGPRVPFVLISPYARTQYVSHEPGNQASVTKFIDTVFNLTPLALLPDELAARQLGEEEFGQKDLGPQDALTPGVTDLLNAFSPSRLIGKADPLPPDYVEIPESLVFNLPQSTGYGCKDLGIIPTDRQHGISNQIPSDFNPRPSTDPTPTP